jgi:hypothetical protein
MSSDKQIHLQYGLNNRIHEKHFSLLSIFPINTGFRFNSVQNDFKFINSFKIKSF